MKNTLVLIYDLIFFAVTAFVFSLLIFNYFCAYPFSIMLSLITALITVMIIYRFSSKNFKEQKLKKQEQQQLVELVNYLNFASKTEQNLILEKALKKKGYTVERIKSNLYIKDKNSLIILKFGFLPVTKVDIVKAFNLLAVTDKAYILAESFEQAVLEFANRFNGRVLCHTGQDLFAFLKQNQSLPMAKYTEFLEKKKKGNIRLLLDKKKSKTFLTFAIFFIAMSYFSPIKIYYLVVGCLFGIYSVILRAFGKTEQKT